MIVRELAEKIANYVDRCNREEVFVTPQEMIPHLESLLQTALTELEQIEEEVKDCGCGKDVIACCHNPKCSHPAHALERFSRWDDLSSGRGESAYQPEKVTVTWDVS